jgi:hypothetical protein
VDKYPQLQQPSVLQVQVVVLQLLVKQMDHAKQSLVRLIQLLVDSVDL